jgi:tuberous sclerosis 2
MIDHEGCVNETNSAAHELIHAFMSQRPRSNTNTFSAFGWRKPKPGTDPVPTSVQQAKQPLDDLIHALAPPQVPSLSCARSLALRIATESPLPPFSDLNSILGSLCATDSPVHLQAIGYDILSAYLDNNNANSLPTADKLTCFSLFFSPITSPPWSADLWENRFKALRSLTKWGKDVIGIEAPLINLVKSWIQGAFDGLCSSDDPLERIERERCIEVLASFLYSVAENQEIIERLPNEDSSGILNFYADLADRFLASTGSPSLVDFPPIFPSPLAEMPSSPSASPRPTHAHKRHPASISAVSSGTILLPKCPVDIAFSLYLKHLRVQLKTIPNEALLGILPLLFRALAHYSSPLPRLSVIPRTSASHLEDQITDILETLFAGSYSTRCMTILKRHLFPPPLPLLTSSHTSIQVSIGAQRTLRNYIRKRLCTRLARAYISREISVVYSPSGAPGHMDVERELMESAWPKEDVRGWDAGRLGRALSSSVRAWIECELTRDDVMRLSVERILDEAAGTLKDVLQELDEREDNSVLEEEEANAVGNTLYQLATYIPQLKYVLIVYRRTFNPAQILTEMMTTRFSSSHSLTLWMLQLVSCELYLSSCRATILPPWIRPSRPPFSSLLGTLQMRIRRNFH